MRSLGASDMRGFWICVLVTKRHAQWRTPLDLQTLLFSFLGSDCGGKPKKNRSVFSSSLSKPDFFSIPSLPCLEYCLRSARIAPSSCACRPFRCRRSFGFSCLTRFVGSNPVIFKISLEDETCCRSL